jgi:uncharacterized protein (TIGR02391 family)
MAFGDMLLGSNMKSSILKKCENLSKRDSFSYRVCKLLKNGEFSEALSSQELTHLLNETAGKKIKVNNLTASMEPLLKEDIVKVKILRNGRNKRKFWFPGWLNKVEIEERLEASGTDFFKLLRIHPEITKVSKTYFYEKHYSDAIEKAFKKVIIMVKDKTKSKGVSRKLDGTPLMFKVFEFERDKNTGEAKTVPILKLNKFNDQVDYDEQEGFMHIFAGVAEGIRNPKIHAFVNQKDPLRTLWYISLASLLATRVEEATKS